MYTIDIRIKADDWHKDTFNTEADYMLTAHLIALATARKRIGIKELDFLPLGNMEYVIWGQGTCLGFLAITYEDLSELGETLEVEA